MKAVAGGPIILNFAFNLRERYLLAFVLVQKVGRGRKPVKSTRRGWFWRSTVSCLPVSRRDPE